MSTLKLSAFILTASLALFACKKEGCTDPLATNYNSSANQDNGTCTYSGTTPGSGGTTTITDNVTTPTTWSGNISVCSQISVSSSLIILEGTTITMCADASINVQANGSLSATGTAASPIIFKGETAVQGYWRGINFQSNNPNNALTYTIVQDGGSYWAYEYSSVIVGSQAKLSIVNSTISNSEQYGLYTNESSTLTAFLNNTFSSNAVSGVNVSAKQLESLDGSTIYNLNNGENNITVRDADISTNATWKKTNTPYLFSGVSTVSGALTIEAGTQMKFKSAAGIDIETSGSITAIGTASEPIVFEGEFASSGYWRALNIKSNNPNNKLAYVTIKDGGQYWAHDYSSLNVSNGARLELDDCTINNSNSWGMFVGTSTTIVAGTATQTDEAGVTAYNNLSGNGTGPNANCVGGGCTVFFD